MEAKAKNRWMHCITCIYWMICTYVILVPNHLLAQIITDSDDGITGKSSDSLTLRSHVGNDNLLLCQVLHNLSKTTGIASKQCLYQTDLTRLGIGHRVRLLEDKVRGSPSLKEETSAVHSENGPSNTTVAVYMS